MKKNKIVDVKLDNEKNLCKVSYDIKGITKEALYQKDSKQLLECVNRYLDFLKNKEKELKRKKESKIFMKRLTIDIILALIGLILVYLIMSLTLRGSELMRLVGYIASLMIVATVFVVAKNITYKEDKDILKAIVKNENEILIAESICDKSKEAISKKILKKE